MNYFTPYELFYSFLCTVLYLPMYDRGLTCAFRWHPKMVVQKNTSFLHMTLDLSIMTSLIPHFLGYKFWKKFLVVPSPRSSCLYGSYLSVPPPLPPCLALDARRPPRVYRPPRPPSPASRALPPKPCLGGALYWRKSGAEVEPPISIMWSLWALAWALTRPSRPLYPPHRNSISK